MPTIRKVDAVEPFHPKDHPWNNCECNTVHGAKGIT